MKSFLKAILATLLIVACTGIAAGVAYYGVLFICARIHIEFVAFAAYAAWLALCINIIYHALDVIYSVLRWLK